MNARQDESGNLMLLAGILITVSFIVTALTLAQVASLERQAVAQKPATLASEWRFLHQRVPSNVNVSIGPETVPAAFVEGTFPAIVETFRAVEGAKGYDILMRLADGNLTTTVTEGSSVAAGKYTLNSIDGRVSYTALVYDGTNDGLLWSPTCPGGSYGGCIVGALVYIRLSDGTSSLEETMVIPANHG